MNASIGFVAAASAIVVVVLAILLPPLWRPARKKASLPENNVDVYRDQLAELERDRAQGTLAEGDFAQARAELQRRLLDEQKPVKTPTAAAVAGARKSAIALLVIVPLAAIAGYALLGTPQGLAPESAPAQAQAHASDQQMEAMLAKLVQKLKDNPTDAKGWLILARSYKALNRFTEAADAFSHAGAIVDTDAALLAEYADVLAASVGGNFSGKPDALLARALKLDPNDPQTLFVAGSVANERKDYARALRYWEPLLAQLQPGSEEAQSIGDAVKQARALLGDSGASPGKLVAEARRTQAAPKNGASGNGAAISGEVTISGKVAARANPGDLLFVFARSAEGSRMPIAVIRTQVSELPLKFRLDDSLALPGGQKLSDFKAVNIEARVAKAGKAQSSAGDLFGRIDGVKTGSADVKLVISEVQP